MGGKGTSGENKLRESRRRFDLERFTARGSSGGEREKRGGPERRDLFTAASFWGAENFPTPEGKMGPKRGEAWEIGAMQSTLGEEYKWQFTTEKTFFPRLDHEGVVCSREDKRGRGGKR